MLSVSQERRTSTEPLHNNTGTLRRRGIVSVVVGLLVVAVAVAALPRALASGPVAGNPTQPGPHVVATGQISYSYKADIDRLDLYYPDDGTQAPVVILLPSGSTGGTANHVGHGRHLASWGYAVAVVDGASFVDGTDIALNAGRASAALDAVKAAEILAGRLDSRAAIVGTHFNGSSAARAALNDERFRAVVGLHPALHPAGSSGAGGVTVPTLILGGNVDGGLLCPYGRSWQQLYFGAGGAHKAVFLFPDARPGDFQEPPYNDPFNFCGKPSADPFVWIRGLMTAWLEYYVRGDASYYGVLYGAGGAPALPPDTSDSIADNAPRGLAVAPVGVDGASVSWDVLITDTMTLTGFDLSRARPPDGFSLVDQPALDTGAYSDSGLEPGVDYKYTIAYRDTAGHLFQTAEPVQLAGGAPTPTPTRTTRPTNTPRPTRTPSPTATTPPTTTLTPTPAPIVPQAYLPLLRRD